MKKHQNQYIVIIFVTKHQNQYIVVIFMTKHQIQYIYDFRYKTSKSLQNIKIKTKHQNHDKTSKSLQNIKIVTKTSKSLQKHQNRDKRIALEKDCVRKSTVRTKIYR